MSGAPPTLRCNDCGYTLEALPANADCPECGRAVARSLPEARVGSAWQRSWNLWRALGAPACEPRAMWERVRPAMAGRSFLLLVVSCELATLPMGVSLWMGGPQTGRPHAMYPLSFALFSALGLLALSLTEAFGLAFIGWRRKWSNSPAHLLAVVGHASPGWIAGGVVSAIAWQALQRLPGVWMVSPVRIDGQVVLPGGWPVGLVMVLAGGVGLLCFEALAYVGMTRLRYTRAG